MNKISPLPRPSTVQDLLLICGNEESLSTTQNLLNRLQTNNIKFRIETATNLKESIQAMCRELPNIVLFNTQGMSNPDNIVKTLTAEFSNTALIVLIDKEAARLGEILINLGAKDYVVVDGAHVEEMLSKSMVHALEVTRLKSEIHKSHEDHFRVILNMSKELIIIVSSQGDILYFNEAAKKLLNFTDTERTNNPLNVKIEPITVTDAGLSFTAIDKSFVDYLFKQQRVMEAVLDLEPPQEKRHMEIAVGKIEWEQAESFVLHLYDITEIKKIAKLETEIREKKRLEKLKDEFLGVVSHEMRTPLTIIKTAVSNLKDGIAGTLPENQLKILATTDRNVERLSRIINDLLDLSRLESGKARVNRQKLNVHLLVDEVMQNFEPAATGMNVTITKKINKNLPEIFADHDMVMQVFNNLLSNSLRYAKGKIMIKAIHKKNIKEPLSQAFRPNEMVEVAVADDGHGIAKENQKLLFNKFEQINRPNGGSGYKGTGLGLAICKEILDLHNSKIWVDSDVDKGTTFSFMLPIYHDYDDFVNVLEQLVAHAKKSGTSLGVLTVKLDNIDSITAQCADKDMAWMFNDLLKEIRQKCLRKPDFVYFRRETKEFVIILAESDRDVASGVCKRIRNSTKDCFCPGGKMGKIFIELKLGMAIFPDDGNDAEKLLEIAFSK